MQLSSAITRLEQLKALRDILAIAIDECTSARDLAPLSRQYRETIRELEEIEGTHDDNDAIGDILASRDADGRSGTVRPNRAAIPEN